jgi:hypothetical protein
MGNDHAVVAGAIGDLRLSVTSVGVRHIGIHNAAHAHRRGVFFRAQNAKRLEARAKALSGSVEDWATESLLDARGAYQDPATGQRIRPGARLADAYQAANLPTV